MDAERDFKINRTREAGRKINISFMIQIMEHRMKIV